MTDNSRSYITIIISTACLFLFFFLQDLWISQTESFILIQGIRITCNALGIFIIFTIYSRKKQDISFLGIKKISPAHIPALFISLPALLATPLLSYLLMYVFRASPNVVINLSPVIKPELSILIISFLFSAFLEELFFRGWLNFHLKSLTGEKSHLILINALLFAFFHMGRGPWAMITAFFSGIILIVLFIKKENLFLNSISHGLYNIIIYLLLTPDS